jgi:hypothetical protein
MRDRDQQVAEFENRSKYCNCPALNELRDLGKKLEALQGACEHSATEADLENPQQSHANFLRKYEQEAEAFETATIPYQRLLGKLVNSEDLYLATNSGPKPQRVFGQEIRAEEGVVTLHCSSCDQQVEVLG